MTTVAYDGRTLAGDTQANSAGMRRTVKKLFRLNDGRLFGGSGDYENCLLARDWLNDGGPKPTLTDDFTGLVIETDGRCMRYEHKLCPSPIAEKFTALGSGRDFAIAAMHMGQSAREAVKLASIYDIGTGPEVECLELVAQRE